MKEKIFCCQETSIVNEWFRLIPYNTTVPLFKKRQKDIQPENYVSDLYKNSKPIKIPKYISREDKIATIKPIDHIVYTAFLILFLPYILLHRAVVFITPPYFNTIIIPILRLFRKKIYIIALDPQTRLYFTYKERADPIVYVYMKIAFFLENIAIKMASKVFVVSKFLEKEYRKKNKKVFYTPNGADVKRISRIKRKRMFRQFTITYAGSHDSWRSTDLIIDAFKLLQKTKKNSKLLLIGGGGNIENIRKMAVGNKDIVVTGWIRRNEDVIAYCKGSDILLMTPRNNLMAKTVGSIKCFEYIACEVPLVVTNTGEHAEWVEKLDVGMVVNADAQSIADGIKNLMKNKNVYKKYKSNCRKYKYIVDFKLTRRSFVEEVQKDLGNL